MTLYELLGKVVCALIVEMDEECMLFRNSRECSSIFGEGVKNYNIKTVSTTDGQVAFLLEKNELASNDFNHLWVKKHIERFAKEPKIFD